MTTTISSSTAAPLPLSDEALFAKYFHADGFCPRIPIPRDAAYREEAYRTYIEFLRRYSRFTRRAVLPKNNVHWGWDKYWNDWCVKEALRRGDVVATGKREIRLINGAIVPMTSEGIRTRLAEIEAKIASGSGSPEVCAEYGITPQRLGMWRRTYGPAAAGSPEELKALREENSQLKQQLATQERALERLRALQGLSALTPKG